MNATGQKEGFKGYVLGFAHGKAGGHVDSLGFVWYKNCSRDSEVFE